MDYTAFTAADFLKDPDFQDWVLHPDPKNIRFWEAWLSQYPEKASEVSKARQALLLVQFKEQTPPAEAMDRVWQKIKVARDPGQKRAVPLYPEQPDGWRQISRMAAMLGGILVLVGVLSYAYVTRTQTYTTAYGQVRTLVLPDSSTVILQANSSLKLARQWFSFQKREVWLEGEAYFAVQHTANHQQFIVHATDRMQVEVLGTEFSVFNRPRGARVVLNSGKVQLKLQPKGDSDAPETKLMMQPGDLVGVTARSPENYTRKVVDPAHFSALKDNKLLFIRTPLGEVAQVLGEVYGLEVQFEDPALAQLTFTGSGPIDQPGLLLTALSASFNLHFSQQANMLLIKAE